LTTRNTPERIEVAEEEFKNFEQQKADSKVSLYSSISNLEDAERIYRKIAEKKGKK
jgi:hypothetical protein